MNLSAVPRDEWDGHWDEYADTAASNPVPRSRRRLSLDLIYPSNDPSRVLDIGCWQGYLIADLHNAYPNANLCGVDYRQWGIDIAGKKVPGAHFFSRDVIKDPDPPAGTDRLGDTRAVCSDVLEHADGLKP